MVSETGLYARGVATLIATWEEIARGSAGASVQRRSERPAAVEAMEAAYLAGGVTRFAGWVHDGDEAMQRDLKRRGYRFAEATRAMGMALDDIRLPRREIDLAPSEWSEYLWVLQLPAGLLAHVDPERFHVLIGRLDGQSVTTGMAYDHDEDCGIYNVATLAHVRRRGLGTSLTALLAHDARDRGCRTATLQSTKIAEQVYASVGFRDLGRFLEYTPARARAA